MGKKITKKTANRVSRTRKPQTSMAYWRSIVDSFDDEIAVIGRDFRIIYANKSVMQRYGLAKSEVIGRYCYELSHNALEPCVSTDCLCPAKEVWDTGKSTQAIHVHCYGTGDDKEERYVDVKAFPLKNSQGETIEAVLIIRDITEVKKMEQRILEANRNLLALNIIADTVSQSLDLDTILNSTLDKVLELMKAHTGGILLLDSATQTLSYRVYRG
jgi:PAS domain S-box-containing protein